MILLPNDADNRRLFFNADLRCWGKRQKFQTAEPQFSLISHGKECQFLTYYMKKEFDHIGHKPYRPQP